METTSICSIPSLAIEHVLEVRPLDVSNAFIHRQLHMQVFVEEHLFSFDQERLHHVCHLHKALYGLS